MDFVFKKGIKVSGLINKLLNENWISIEDAKPNIQLCISNHSIYFISNQIRIKTKTGYDFIARYKVLMMDYTRMYTKELAIFFSYKGLTTVRADETNRCRSYFT